MRYYKMMLASICLLTLSACAELGQKTIAYPSVSLSGLQLLSSGYSKQNYEVQLKIENPNAFPLPLSKLDYELILNDAVFASGVNEEAITIPANAAETITLQVTSNFASLYEQALSFGNSIIGNNASREFNYGLKGNLFFAEWLPQVPYDYSGQVNLGFGSLIDKVK
ncbi:LEA type 2 family protein [Candidatus Albibeggiatoa sp. nov. NOAA]|uniref:LEA type 2 family protein n=1 Tax=Candidatus Albibeggiatoa sp. nov. NOAA TaxID=3162724 RepID=UPI0032F47B69|nr:LEA type 2 family protein [Thiotrichaceae bacterium]